MGERPCSSAASCPVEQPDGPAICPLAGAADSACPPGGAARPDSSGGRDFRVQWHEVCPPRSLAYQPAVFPESVAICLNLAGHGKICAADGEAVQLEPGTAAFYGRRRGELHAERAGAQRHQFITLELSLAFLRRQKKDNPPWHSAVQRLLAGRTRLTLSDPVAFTPAHRLLIGTLRHPPPVAQVCRLWYQAKALEAASLFLVAPGPAEPCPDEQAASRLQRLNQERALAVAAYLREHLAEPLTLEQIGRAVGVSPCYLSRIFAQAMGCGIFQYLRDLRLDRAAELLRQGRGNVTEAAFSVGYSSLSHFSQAFRERFGCCPGLYPLQTPAQKPRS